MSEYRFVVSGRGIPLGIFDTYAHALRSLCLTVGVPNLQPSVGSGHWEFALPVSGVMTQFTITAVNPSKEPNNLLG